MGVPPLVLPLPLQGPSLKSLRLDRQWKEKYVNQLIDSISAGRLAKSICSQFRTKVGASHEAFLSAMKQLELRISGRLKETEGQRSTIRKVWSGCGFWDGVGVWVGCVLGLCCGFVWFNARTK